MPMITYLTVNKPKYHIWILWIALISTIIHNVESKMKFRNLLDATQSVDMIIYDGLVYNPPVPQIYEATYTNQSTVDIEGSPDNTTIPSNSTSTAAVSRYLPILVLDRIPTDSGFTFNPCDISTFTIENIEPVLDEMLVTPHGNDAGGNSTLVSWRETGWIAVVRYSKIMNLCKGMPIPQF